ncbi:MAG: hypothetical protein ACRCST_16155 [Turicibacter sp.]
MITKALLGSVFGIVNICIALIPSFPQMGFDLASCMKVMSMALDFFPLDLWLIVINNIIFWLVISFAWAIIEWIYKKLPGVS